MMAGVEGVGSVRCRHLTHVISAFGKLKLNMQILWLRHFVDLPISVFDITRRAAGCIQKLIITLYDRKVHFVVRYWEEALVEYLDSIICMLNLIKSRCYFSG